MKQIKYDTDEELETMKRRALILKPNQPNVVATSMGWSQPRPFGQMELLVSFANLDEILGIETLVDSVDEPIDVVIESTTVEPEEINDDEDLPPANDLASLIIAKPVAEVKVKSESDMKEFLAQLKEDADDKDPVETTTKKKPGRARKATT